jgi:hypothetical protein
MRRAGAAAPVFVALLLAAVASGATRVDGSVSVDLVAGPPRAGVPFTATVVMSSAPGPGGGPYEFTVAVRLSPTLVFLRASNPFQPVLCTPSGQTITCQGRVIDVEVSTNIDFSLRATSAGEATVEAMLTVVSAPDTNAQNNTAQLVVRVAAAPTSTKRVGTERNDVLRGTGRNDQLYGLGGADVLRGLAGNDLLDGGRGNDRLFGGPGLDRLLGGPGDDTIYSVDSQRDSVNCARGRDNAVVDRRDRVAGCERVRRLP